jgi:hypothetical protein
MISGLTETLLDILEERISGSWLGSPNIPIYFILVRNEIIYKKKGYHKRYKLFQYHLIIIITNKITFPP